jgi:hypothetical protein
MKQKKRWIHTGMCMFIFLTFFTLSSVSRDYSFLPIEVENASTYDNDRVVFQRVEKATSISRDHSFETLLVIKNRKSYQITDGYDSIYTAQARRYKIVLMKLYGENEADLVWTNKINGKPDYIEILDRRTVIMKNSNEEFVSANFGAFYKSIRDKFIREHVNKFRQLMKNRKDTGFYIDAKQLPRPLYQQNVMEYPDKFSVIVKARAMDGTMYTCEDIDGDGVTETFMVDAHDGFNWGYKSGPNLILIFKNTDKDIEAMIGKLAKEAMYGGTEEEKEMIESFPKEKAIEDLIKWLTPKEPDNK